MTHGYCDRDQFREVRVDGEAQTVAVDIPFADQEPDKCCPACAAYVVERRPGAGHRGVARSAEIS